MRDCLRQSSWDRHTIPPSLLVSGADALLAPPPSYHSFTAHVGVTLLCLAEGCSTETQKTYVNADVISLAGFQCRLSARSRRRHHWRWHMNHASNHHHRHPHHNRRHRHHRHHAHHQFHRRRNTVRAYSLPVCSLACWSACLLVCLFVCLPACCPAGLLVLLQSLINAFVFLMVLCL